jgi:hypothetical protein
MGHGRGWCKRCREFKWIKARKLCESCYMQVKASQQLHLYPTLHRMRFIDEATKPVNVCRCFSPIREELTVFNAAQCKKCGKKLP